MLPILFQGSDKEVSNLAGEKSGKKIRSTAVFGDYLIMLAVPCVIAVRFYGFNALSTLAVCVASAVACDILASLIIHKHYFTADFSAICSGLMIALMMPAGVPVYVCIIACAFAVLAVKIPFGGGMRTPFVPAAAGFAFAAICFRDLVFTYSAGRNVLNGTSLGAMLNRGIFMRINFPVFLDMITGNYAGPMGTTCAVVFLGCLIFLLIRRPSCLPAAGGFLGACIVFSYIFPRTSGSFFLRPLPELAAGSLLFAAVFFLTNPSTLPKHTANKAVYGVFTGIVTMVMRKLGVFEEPVCFAVLIGNAFSPLLDIATDRIRLIIRSKQPVEEQEEEVAQDE